jgi:hypothetical protein
MPNVFNKDTSALQTSIPTHAHLHYDYGYVFIYNIFQNHMWKNNIEIYLPGNELICNPNEYNM